MISNTNHTKAYKSYSPKNINGERRSEKKDNHFYKSKSSKRIRRTLFSNKKRIEGGQVSYNRNCHKRIFDKGEWEKMSEQLSQVIPRRIGKYLYYRIGETTIRQLKENKLIPDRNYEKIFRKKPDGLIVCHGKIQGIVESKDVQELNSDKKELKAIDQEINVARELCKLLIVTDNKSKTIWINTLNSERIKGKDGEEIKTIFNKDSILNVDKLENLLDEIDSSITKTNSQLKEENIIDPSQLANKMWQTIWVATGKSPVKCLYNVVELLIFKFLSDLKVLDDTYNFKKVYEMAKSSPEEALVYYVKNSREKMRKLFPRGEDKTTIVNGTIFVDEHEEPVLAQAVLFNRSLRHLNDYENDFGTFNKISKQFKTKLYESFLKQEVESLGQYFTPRKIVQSIIRMSGLDEEPMQYKGKRICDPFCGVGGFPLEILNMNENMKKEYIPNKDGEINVPFTLSGFDKGSDEEEARTIILAKANMLIYLSDIIFKYSNLTKEFAKEFNKTFKLFRDNLGTFGHIIKLEDEKYDYILTNPPYVTRGSGVIKEEIKSNGLIKENYPINARGLEGLSIEWIINSLKKGGHAYVIIPDGVLERKDDNRLRQHLLKECYLDSIISLPVRTFFANFRKTYILCFTKKNNPEDTQKFPVFTYIVNNIGEELTKVERSDISDSDLPEMETMFRMFLGIRNNIEVKPILEKISLKCKIQPIQKFKDSKNWRIDNWWSYKEKIKLGLEKDKDKINPEELLKTFESTKKEVEEYLDLIKKKDSEINEYSSIPLISLFKPEKGDSKFTKRYIREHRGDFPLYSSKTKDNGLIGNIDSYKYDFKECLTWTTDGIYAGKVFLRNGRFSMTTHCGLLVPLREDVYLPYVGYILSEILPKKALGQKGQNKRVTIDIINELEIKIPVKKDGTYDIEKQQDLSLKFQTIEEAKIKVEKRKKEFNDNFKDILGL